MSCLRYNSRTIFWTFPLLVDLTKILLEIFEACGSEAKDLLRLVMLAVDVEIMLDLNIVLDQIFLPT